MIKEIETPAGERQSQTAATVQTSGRQFVLRSKIKPDPNQPRKEFKNLHELADSLKADGFLEVLKVRFDNDHYTLIDGERRWRASEIAGIERVPIEVIEAKDVLKVQLLYGTQRENLNALEQAQTAQRLLEERRKGNPKYSVEELGRELGLKRATVYELMALNKVSEPVRQALLAGKLDASKARCFATVPVSQHEKLLKEITQPLYGDEPMSVRKVEEHIESRYSKQLKGAPFDQTAEYKVNGYVVKGEKGERVLPVCAKCPQRAGNIEGWVGSNPNVCTNTECFGIKTKLFAEQRLAIAKARGQEIIPAEKYRQDQYRYAELGDKDYYDNNQRTWGQLAKAAGVTPRVTINREGAAIEVLAEEDKKAIHSKLNISSGHSGGSAADKAAEKRRRKKVDLYDGVAKAATVTILDKLVTTSLHEKLWTLLADAVAGELGIDRTAHIAKRRGLCRTQGEANDALEKWLTDKARTNRDRQQFIVEALLCADWNESWSDAKFRDSFDDIAKLAGVNLEKLLADAKETKPQPAAKAAAKGKKK